MIHEMIRIVNLVVLLTCSIATAESPRLVDLSKLTNLDDHKDDTKAIASAIRLAGDGGGILIPYGRAILSSALKVPHKRFTLIGSGPSVSTLILKKSATLNMKSSKASFAFRNIEISAGSESLNVLLNLSSESGGELTMRHVSLSSKAAVGKRQFIVQDSTP